MDHERKKVVRSPLHCSNNRRYLHEIGSRADDVDNFKHCELAFGLGLWSLIHRSMGPKKPKRWTAIVGLPELYFRVAGRHSTHSACQRREESTNKLACSRSHCDRSL